MEEKSGMLSKLKQASSAEEELKILQAVQDRLLPSLTEPLISDLDADVCEKQFLESGFLEDDTPFPGHSPEMLYSKQNDLNDFTYYLLNRRYGWSELEGKPGSKARARPAKASVMAGEVRHKALLNDLLDDFIKWYMCQKMTKALLESLMYSIQQATNKPVVRNQTIIHAMNWIKLNLDNLEEEHFTLVKDIILLGLTDVWSAIRNACVARLSGIIEHITLDQLQSFFSNLAAICKGEDSSWQAKEGAVMGINIVVRRFQWIGFDIENSSPRDTKSTRTEYYLKFGKEEMSEMPVFITSQMHTVIFPLLAHPQLSIRENATKAFSSFLSRCEFKEALTAFRDLIKQLCQGINLPSYETANGNLPLPHATVLGSGFRFMDAYAAEGLLGVCVFLVKHIPPGFLLPNWPLYFSTFSLYLMHPASTVRQATSTIFKYLVAKDSSNPTLLKLVLQNLSTDWKVNMDLLLQPCNLQHFCHFKPLKTRGERKDSAGSPRSHDSHPSLGPSRTRSYSWTCPRGRRKSITKLDETASIAEHVETHTPSIMDGEATLAETWEWREGRLFAYELIFRFLIKNHWLYTFGLVSQQSVPKLPHGQSIDEGNDHKSPRDSKHAKLQHSQSYGGQALRNMMPRSPGSPDSGSSGTSTKHGHSYAGTTMDSLFVQLPRKGKKECNTVANEVDVDIRSESPLSTSGSSAGRPPAPQRGQTVGNFYVPQVQTEPPGGQIRARSGSIEHHLTCPSLRSLVHQYSYYVKPNVPFRPPGTLSGPQASSLLTHTRVIDKRAKKEAPRRPSKEEVGLIPNKDQNMQRSTLCPSPLSNATDQGFPDDREPAWLSNLELKPLSTLLKNMLYQTVECLADTRWELRRMGQQVLPCVVEVIRWYDMAILEELWNEHLTPNTTLLCYGACIAFKYSLSHAAKLAPMLSDPPVTWQDSETCKRTVHAITTSVTAHLALRVTCANSLLHRHCFDRLSLVAMEILMLVHTHFTLPADQKSREVRTIVNFCQQMFLHAHSDSKLGTDLAKVVQPVTFVTPLDGFLSFSPREEKVQHCAKQVEKHVLSELQQVLVPFLKVTKVTDILSLLPVTVFYIGEYVDDEKVANTVLQCVQIMTTNLIEQVRQEGLNEDRAVEVNRYTGWALQEIASLVSSRSTELHILRHLLELHTSLNKFASGPQHLKSLFQAVCSRISMVDTTKPNFPAHENLVILSNDIASPVPFTDKVEDDTDSEEEETKLLAETVSDTMLQESLILNGSNNSGGQLSGRQSAMSGCSVPSGGRQSAMSAISGGSVEGSSCRLMSQMSNPSDAGSDWDSWSEDEEDQPVLYSLFSEFLDNLHKQYSKLPIEEDKTSTFAAELRKVSEKDRKLLKGIMGKS
ncbi:uncharacterized protein LOC106160455 [Lingula anatina]|uniref:Uncharacterized protein LOC106160455 n=1 Tax=Lingula anatina TaxID=7574 RepID=A0A1S3I2R5_LINAN|nr:uncharacterized protein LOC106160455 [Lingula anatina]|eukprot:XP_013392533.1 uncharacterized protein LOC106160455 [Lingula anatina]